MGSNSYSTSRVRSDLSKMMDEGLLIPVGKSDVRHTLSDEFIFKNLEALNKRFTNPQDAFNASFYESEPDAAGTVFFRDLDHVFVRRTKDIDCIGATKGDFVVKPRLNLPTKT